MVGSGERHGPRPRLLRAGAGVAAAAVVPLAVVVLLRTQPGLDARWESQQLHFWIVLAAAGVAGALGWSVSVAARRRRDARLFVISLAFIAGAGFLGLHALATPGVLVGPNAGFELATPVGLVLGSGLLALSAVEIRPRAARQIMARSQSALAALVALLALWAAVSLAELPPLDDPLQQEVLDGWQVGLAALGVLGYGFAAVAYLGLYRRRRAPFVLAVAIASALLAVTMVVIAVASNWRISWWQWHVLMLGALVLIAAAARQEWHEERFSALYLEETLAGTREASILFADLEGFTGYAERTDPVSVREMLDTYLARLVPLLQAMGGEVHQLAGDGVMVVFNKQGDQPDHARLAARAALAFQAEASAIADARPGTPRFRVGVNSGEVAAGVLGERGHRKHDVVGDAVNLAARLEAAAAVGEVVVGEGTWSRLPDGARGEQLPPLVVKGKSGPVTAYVLRALPTEV